MGHSVLGMLTDLWDKQWLAVGVPVLFFFFFSDTYIHIYIPIHTFLWVEYNNIDPAMHRNMWVDFSHLQVDSEINFVLTTRLFNKDDNSSSSSSNNNNINNNGNFSYVCMCTSTCMCVKIFHWKVVIPPVSLGLVFVWA